VRGYRSPQEEPPAPAAEALGGSTAPVPSALAQAALGGDLADKVHPVLEANATTPLARALASPGRALAGRDS
jgi:hypothetical protein